MEECVDVEQEGMREGMRGGGEVGGPEYKAGVG